MQRGKSPDKEDDALGDLERDLFGEDGEEYYSIDAEPRNWLGRIALVVVLLATAFIVLSITGLRH
jgi:hypothetical protein